MSTRAERVRALRARRPRSRFARASAVALLALAAWAWLGPTFSLAGLVNDRSARNVERFLRDIRPYPLQDKPFDAAVFWNWLTRALEGRGLHAVLATLGISVAAIVLAGVWATFLGPLAARNLAHPEPFLPAARPPSPARRLAWRAVAGATRAFCVFMRAIPEYVWAFLLLALFGPGAWPVVLALALHNAGILGKLNAEVIENLEPATPRAMRALGATRIQIAATAIFPLALNRFLLYFFYRWETCVREATVLGTLGFVSLGYHIKQMRGAQRLDEMLLFILLGAAIILAGDVVSTVARALIRRAK